MHTQSTHSSVQNDNANSELQWNTANHEEGTTQEKKFKINWKALPTILRWVGGTTLLFSALSFLIFGLVDASSLSRYFNFLAFTGTLTACGFFCITRWKDDKGARTFFSLATAFLPAHFAMLGALVFAQALGYAQAFDDSLSVFSFSPMGVTKLGLTLLVAIAVLIPVCYTGFAAMARPMAKKLTTVFVVTNAFLLVPVREGQWVALIGFAMLAALVAIDRITFSKVLEMKSRDGLAMRAMLFAPLLVLILRNVMLHGIETLLLSTVAASIACILFLGVPNFVKHEGTKRFSQMISFLPAGVSWYYVLESVLGSSEFFASFFLPAVILPLAALMAALSFHTVGNGVIYRKLAANIAVLGMLYHLVEHSSPAASLLCSLTAVVVLIAAFMMKEKSLLFSGSVGLVLSLVYHFQYVIQFYNEHLWLSLAVTGSVVVLLSSYIERHGRLLIEKSGVMRKKIGSWN